ncbi:MAG: hypothetical protein ACK51M_01125 [Burkholderiales bacterium]
MSCMVAACVSMPLPCGRFGIPEPRPDVDLGTPDRAVRTWWALSDWAVRRSAEQDGCRAALRARTHEPRMAQLELLDGAVKTSFASAWRSDPEIDLRQTVSRSIERVDAIGVDEAIVYAVLRNETPIPPGVELTNAELERRDRGVPVRYTVQRGAAQAWRIVRVELSGRDTAIPSGWIGMLDRDFTVRPAWHYVDLYVPY